MYQRNIPKEHKDRKYKHKGISQLLKIFKKKSNGKRHIESIQNIKYLSNQNSTKINCRKCKEEII